MEKGWFTFAVFTVVIISFLAHFKKIYALLL